MTLGMVIVGAGEAGVRAALTLRRLGYKGPVTLIGEEPQAPYERPPLSKTGLTDPTPEPRPIAGLDDLPALNIRLRTGTQVRAIDRTRREIRLDGGETIGYDRLLLATGARARRLSLPGLPDKAPLTLRTRLDSERIRERLRPGLRAVLFGGGFIGLELAASLTQAGARVTVLEVQPRLLQRAVPADLADRLLAEHRRRGVDIRLSAGIETAEPGGIVTRLFLKDGTVLEGDLLIAGIGADPNTELAEAAGLACDNGTAVDAYLRTSDPAIFAAGDGCSFPLGLYDQAVVRLESWRCAQEQGEVAAANMLGGMDRYDRAPWFWSDQFDLGLQIVGLPGFGQRTVSRTIDDRTLLQFHLADNGRLLAASGLGPGNAVARDIKIAERLINRRAHPDPDALADPGLTLKRLLK